jgi:ribosomal small subunit protein bTHX
MGKGDKKSAKGKRVMGSYGNSRKRKESKPIIVVAKKEKPKAVSKAEVKEVKPKAAAKPKVEKKTVEKKTTEKKTTAKKTTTKKTEE